MIASVYVWMAWPVVAAAVVCALVRRRARWPQMIAALALATYALWICSVAFFPLPMAGSGEAAALAAGYDGRPRVNMVPIRAILAAFPGMSAGQIVREFGGNVLLFAPFTLAGPLFWRSLRTWRWPLAVGAGGSLLIEVVQFALSGVAGFMYRQPDIDDLILSTLGALLGYAVFLAADRLGPWVSRRFMRKAASGVRQRP